MRLLLRGPETGDVEAGVEVGAEVPHPGDGEGDVDAELDGETSRLVGLELEGIRGGVSVTLKTSRLGPAMVIE